MLCRQGCGACCIAPSINEPFIGMPGGKPAGVACVHLLDDASCAIYQSPERPAVCSAFAASPEFCGESRQQALALLEELEVVTDVSVSKKMP